MIVAHYRYEIEEWDEHIIGVRVLEGERIVASCEHNHRTEKQAVGCAIKLVKWHLRKKGGAT